jgi:hypothetical protein
LVRHDKSFRLWVLCFDDLAYRALQALELAEIIPISLEEFEAGDADLSQAKGNRSRIEFYFTCTPSLPLYILRHCTEVDVITYLDADLNFFSDPSPIYEELGDLSVLIIGHRFPEHLGYMKEKGIYNVGFLSFRRDDVGWQCLRWWRERCLDWCYDRVEDGRYADQKYLDDWPARFPGVVVLGHAGAGLAPWNVGRYALDVENGQVLVDSQPLVFFHFHGLKQATRWLYELNLATYGLHADPFLKQHVYGPYLRELDQVHRELAVSLGASNARMNSIRDSTVESNLHGPLHKRLRKMGRLLSMSKMFLQGQLLVVVGGRVI